MLCLCNNEVSQLYGRWITISKSHERHMYIVQGTESNSIMLTDAEWDIIETYSAHDSPSSDQSEWKEKEKKR